MEEVYIRLLNLGFYEATFALEGLEDAHVWQRPAERLLSVGELAGHIATWYALRLAGGAYPKHDVSSCPVKSPLVDERFSYHTSNLTTSPTADQRAMSAAQVLSELQRVHSESLARFQEQNPDLDTPVPGGGSGQTYRMWLEYVVFHVAYHVGQIYSVRHLLGEETPDN